MKWYEVSGGKLYNASGNEHLYNHCD